MAGDEKRQQLKIDNLKRQVAALEKWLTRVEIKVADLEKRSAKNVDG